VTHEVLPRVIDVASPDASRNDVGRMKWRLPLLPKSLYVVYCCIYSCVLDVYVIGSWMISNLL